MDSLNSIVNLGLVEGVIICMLTGKEEPDKKMNYLKEYVLDYIRKPFDYDTFVNIVKEYLSYVK